MLELRVNRSPYVTPRIRQFEFVAADGGALPAFTAGSHIDIELGNGDERSYSLLNDQGDTRHYVVAVLREAAGRGGSDWMHDKLRDGDVIRCSEPANNFRLSEGGDHYTLIAGGIGITAILSMAARLKEIGRDYAIHYAARSPAEAAFVDEMTARHGGRAHFYYDGGNPETGLDLIDLLRVRPSAAHVYVCGPVGMIRATREAGSDWPQGTVHYELFKGTDIDVATRARDLPFEVVLKRAGKTFTIPAERTILDVLKANGYRIKSLCKEGVCGTCRVKLISGAVEHRDDCLDDDDRCEALQVCVSRAMPGETLVLDL